MRSARGQARRTRHPKGGQAMVEYLLLMGTVIAVILSFKFGFLQPKMMALMGSMRNILTSSGGTADYLLNY